MKIRNYLASILIGILLISPLAKANSGDLSLTENSVSFSTDYFLENYSVRIWASVENNSPHDLLGSVRFMANGENLDSDQPISALAGNTDDVFVDWIPPYDGEYTITVSVIPWDSSEDNPDNNMVTKNILVLADMDGDGITDADDTDRDGDGTLNEEDAFPDNGNESKDSDGDGIGNNADEDDDNDGVNDSDDAFPENPLYWSDTDGDGIPDQEDEDIDGDGLTNDEESEKGTDPQNIDSDNDGVNDMQDPFPLNSEENSDLDGDGIGDNVDEDMDGDGIVNKEDSVPDNAAPQAQVSENVILTGIDEDVSFDASESFDTDGNIVKYIWDFGDVQLSGEEVSISFNESGVKNALLTVIDDSGQEDSIEIKVRVLNYKFILFTLLLTIVLISLAFYLIYRYNRRASEKRGNKKSFNKKSKKK